MSSFCDWIQDFLTGRPQVVKMGQFTSNSITLNVGAPQGCVLSPLLYSLYTHNCLSSHSSTSIVKFADDTVVLGLISNNDETAYLDEVERFISLVPGELSLSERDKTKELIVDFVRIVALQRVVRLAERISGSALPSLQDIYLKRSKSRAVKIIKDSNPPGNRLFILLPSGKHFRSMMAKTERLRRSFFTQAIRLLNSNSF